jgi:hypothetical protein
MFRPICCIAILMAMAAAWAQEGHPLAGTWHGTWGPTAKDRNDITVVLLWDGKNVTGMINPGPDSIKLQNASLDPQGWLVHLEGDAKDGSGVTVHLVADGKIENLTSLRRSIAGTWTQGPVKGDFKITRDN